MATIAVFVALGGTSYAVLHIGSADVTDNSLRSRDIHDRTLRARDLRRNSLGGGIIKESGLRTVPSARSAERLGGATAQDLRLKCPADTVGRAGICVETAARPADGFLGAINHCDQAGRGLITMPELDAFLRATGPLPEPEWTGSVYRNSAAGGDEFEQLETVLLSGTGDVSYDRVYLAVQHPFRCVALPSN